MAGAVLTETIFSWPGVGKWLIESIGRRDYPALQGGVMLVSTVVILVNCRRSALRRDQPEDPPWPLTSRSLRPPTRARAFSRSPRRSPRSGRRFAKTAARCSGSRSSSRSC